MSDIVVLLVITPLLTAFLLSVTAVPHKVTHVLLGRVRMLLSVVGLSILCGLLLKAAPDILSGTIYTYTMGGWTPFLGITLQLDALSFTIAVISVLVCFLGMIYSFSYMKRLRGLGKYDTFYFLLITGILGVLLTRDLFNMYVFLEVLNVSVYVLISSGEKKENYKASLKYLVLGSLSSALFLLAVGIIYSVTGSLNMDFAAEKIHSMIEENPQLAHVVISLFIVSLGVKSGIIPLHFWLPDAHSMAPSPVSALLSGIVIKISVYAMIRLFSLFGMPFYYDISPLVAYMGAATALVGALVALTQKNLKRMLAYSSISQIGIIVTGIGIGTDLAVTGALFHIVNHALMKSGLFLCAGIMIHYSGTRKISQLRFKAPGIVVSFVVLSLGIIGIPPLNGFVSKFIICYGAVKAHDTALVLVILAASLLSCVYYFRVIQTFFKKRRRRNQDTFQVSRSMSFPVYVLAALSVILGLFPLIGLRTIELALQVVMG